MGNVSIVIGSWGSYNECNNRALGSKWLKLNLFSDWEDVEQELTKQGFELKGIDEVAYIRFASVYRKFTDVTHFMDFIKEFENMLSNKQ